MIEAGLTTKENYEQQTGKTYDRRSNMVTTGLYTSLDYVLKRTEKKDRFNLLSVIINPEKDCCDITLDVYTFMGYDLLDQYYEKSALTNCGGHDETFLPEELNKYGLIDEYEKALDIKHRLFENNPEEGHAKTNLIAIWRHNTIGRKLTWKIVGRKISRILFPETWR